MTMRVKVTGVVRYNPEKSWGGLTIIPSLPNMSTAKGAVLYDMNGNIVNRWEGLMGAFDNKMLPGGSIIGTTGFAKGYFLDAVNITQQNWSGDVEWSFDKGGEVLDVDTGEYFTSARQHHDYQREGNPVGYFAPGQEPLEKGKMLINSIITKDVPELSDYPINDNLIKEIDEDGNVLWTWSLLDHWDQFGIETTGKTIFKSYGLVVSLTENDKYVKEIFCNNLNYIGPNKWYDAGDERFHPDNIISDIRILNTSFIIDKKTGDIVWRIGPDFESTKELQEIGQIVGQHHVHMIPKGLPGEGNILIFDNGGQAGLGRPTPCAPTGYLNATRSYSRVLEINPVTLKVEWSYNSEAANASARAWQDKLTSEYCSSADRLPNGNTLITESIRGRVIEVTPDHEIVWEFINPGEGIFRAHRYPYDWFPQVDKPVEKAVTPLKNSRIRIDKDGVPYLTEDDLFFQDSKLVIENPNTSKRVQK